LFWRLAFSDPSFVTSEFIAARLKLASQPGAKEAFLKTLRDGLDWRGVRAAYVNPLREALPLMKMPILVIWGKQDNFISPAHVEVLRTLPNFQVKLFDQCGHLPQIECADSFNETALSFWEEVDNHERGASSPTLPLSFWEEVDNHERGASSPTLSSAGLEPWTR
jgi:pimeloyl-ACP methyl ester carboxylesterase